MCECFRCSVSCLSLSACLRESSTHDAPCTSRTGVCTRLTCPTAPSAPSRTLPTTNLGSARARVCVCVHVPLSLHPALCPVTDPACAHPPALRAHSSRGARAVPRTLPPPTRVWGPPTCVWLGCPCPADPVPPTLHTHTRPHAPPHPPPHRAPRHCSFALAPPAPAAARPSTVAVHRSPCVAWRRVGVGAGRCAPACARDSQATNHARAPSSITPVDAHAR